MDSPTLILHTIVSIYACISKMWEAHSWLKMKVINLRIKKKSDSKQKVFRNARKRYKEVSEYSAYNGAGY